MSEEGGLLLELCLCYYRRALLRLRGRLLPPAGGGADDDARADEEVGNELIH